MSATAPVPVDLRAHTSMSTCMSAFPRVLTGKSAQPLSWVVLGSQRSSSLSSAGLLDSAVPSTEESLAPGAGVSAEGQEGASTGGNSLRVLCSRTAFRQARGAVLPLNACTGRCTRESGDRCDEGVQNGESGWTSEQD